MTIATSQRSLWDVIIIEPLDLVKAQPHQVLISTGSVAIMGQYAGSGGIVHPLVGYCIAVGVEWAYLRGLASDSKAPTKWGAILNWSAFGVLVLWGVLWVGEKLGVLGTPEGLIGWLLAASHIVPVAWLSLCAAMTHSAAARAEVDLRTQREEEDRQRALAIEAEQRQLAHAAEQQRLVLAAEIERERVRAELEQQAKDAEVARWAEAQRIKAELKASQRDAPGTLSQTASHGVTTPSRDAQRRAVVTAIVTHGAALNVTRAAAEIGISRPMFYKLKAEAQALGELEG